MMSVHVASISTTVTTVLPGWIVAGVLIGNSIVLLAIVMVHFTNTVPGSFGVHWN